jgi:pyruvate carboxylase
MPAKIKRFKKLMVANRGEIAIRVLRAASELKIRTVAMYTYEDRLSLHRYKADESYQIGAKSDPLKPYLDIEEILRVAKEAGVDAIHPGYGFLSENVTFAKRCREEGIKFIGPSPEAMTQVGDKMTSKKLARKLGIPLIEDSLEDIITLKIAKTEANKIGYPVMVKAASGGGGRGMRVVYNDAQMETEFDEARNEARTAFGDDTVFIEKYIDDPKHIEVQIFGDEHGNLVHMYERDCSVQRRFQKVVEIAPAITLQQETRDKLYKYALDLCRAADYSCAGTVEFLVDKDENIYFIEVNPRIQVEHTVTEQITGIDIVYSQILVCMGLELSHPRIFIKSQEDVKVFGCAIQCRVTTEDPANDFKPDYGTLLAYRSASGMGIRLDAGSAYAGAVISPFFDSLLVKVTAYGRTMTGAADRLHRALREFRVRGVKTNIDFLLNLLQNDDFRRGKASVNFIKTNPELFEFPRRLDRGTKVLRFLADTIVNGNSDVKYRDARQENLFSEPVVPAFDYKMDYPSGSKQLLERKGADGIAQWVKKQKNILYTDTTFRDGHQSLLATRMRTYDMMQVAESFARNHADDVFSMEVWGGATFDVAMRFLKEDPWKRLKNLRKAIPNVLFQMLLRGSNGVGYKAYPDNLIEAFIENSAKEGIDIFRIFDSLNWVENMKVSIRRVREMGKIAEACICYSGDVSDIAKTKFDLQYYVDMARQLEDEGAHMLCIKDMAGLLKPRAAEILIPALKKAVDLPIHLHTHDTSSMQAVTYHKAVDAGVDIVDLALSSMSGLTSQPNFNSFAATMQGHPREKKVNLASLNEYSHYWEAVRKYYYPFETELRAGTAEVYENEIPGGQYSNLRPQARGLGLEEQFEKIKHNYKDANDLFGGLIKVTPSSKVVGDMAMFMTSNNLTKQDVIEQANSLSFPDSVKALMRGELGQIKGGFPKKLQKAILKKEKPFTDRPNGHLEPIDFKKEFAEFQKEFGAHNSIKRFISYKLYPKVFRDFHDFKELKGAVRSIPTPAFFYGMEPGEEMLIEIEAGKTITVRFVDVSEPNTQGIRTAFFKLNGQTRAIEVQDLSLDIEIIKNKKAEADNEIGAPLQGNLSRILVKVGQKIDENTPLFIIEAMKMESTITSPLAGKVKAIHLKEKSMVEQDDLVVELEG